MSHFGFGNLLDPKKNPGIRRGQGEGEPLSKKGGFNLGGSSPTDFMFPIIYFRKRVRERKRKLKRKSQR